MDERLEGARADARRVLAVADWSVDAVAAAEEIAMAARDAVAVAIVVPARLPGLDWIGDPNASRPCACEQLGRLERLVRARGVEVEAAQVGDPEMAPAIVDALETWSADEVLVVTRGRARRANPLELSRRIARRTRLPVRRIGVGLSPTRERRGRRALHCGRPGLA